MNANQSIYFNQTFDSIVWVDIVNCSPYRVPKSVSSISPSQNEWRTLQTLQGSQSILNSVDKTKLSCDIPHRHNATVSFETCRSPLLQKNEINQKFDLLVCYSSCVILPRFKQPRIRIHRNQGNTYFMTEVLTKTFFFAKTAFFVSPLCFLATWWRTTVREISCGQIKVNKWKARCCRKNNIKFRYNCFH